jgi:hypothetical protein
MIIGIQFCRLCVISPEKAPRKTKTDISPPIVSTVGSRMAGGTASDSTSWMTAAVVPTNAINNADPAMP